MFSMQHSSQARPKKRQSRFRHSKRCSPVLNAGPALRVQAQQRGVVLLEYRTLRLCRGTLALGLSLCLCAIRALVLRCAACLLLSSYCAPGLHPSLFHRHTLTLQRLRTLAKRMRRLRTNRAVSTDFYATV